MKQLLTIVRTTFYIVLVMCVATLGYILSFYDAQEATHTRECAVVFGAAVWPGGVASDALADRAHAAIDLYQRGVVTCVIFSGAPSVYGTHEVDVMLTIADERAVPARVLETDYAGFNTKRTVANLTPSRSYVFVSNDFHLARIALLARKAGLRDVDFHASEYRTGRYSREVSFIAREIVAFWYYALRE